MLRINKRQLQFFIRARFAKVIYADSMPRSGSTLIFNALRLLLESDPECDLQSAWVRQARSLPRANTYLIKIHGMNVIDAWRASKIVYSYRDPRVALVSMCRKFGGEPTIGSVRIWMRDFAFAQERADILIRYETMMKDVAATVEDLANLLGIEADAEKMADDLAKTLKSGSAPDQKTLLHGDHATGTKDDDWRDYLPEELKAQISAEFGPWLEKHGYPRH